MYINKDNRKNLSTLNLTKTFNLLLKKKFSTLNMPAPLPDTVDGPRKCCPTERVTENGDPLVQKKARTTNTKSTPTARVTSKSTITKATTLDRRASIEDVAEPTPVAGPQPHHSSRILEAADGSDNDNDTRGMPGLEDIEAENSDDKEGEETEPEDDEAELGKLNYTICQSIQLIWQFIARLMKR